MRAEAFFSVKTDIYQSLLGLKSKSRLASAKAPNLFFREGWGDEVVLEKFRSPALFNDEPVAPEIRWVKHFSGADEFYMDGTFASPCAHDLPPAARTSLLRMFAPRHFSKATPVCIVFAMTGDEGFAQRAENIARPLLSKGIATVLLENPYYGARRVSGEKGDALTRVQDLLLMNAAAATEGRALIKFFQQEGYEKIGVAGVSQGAMVAAVVAAKTDADLATACSLPAHSPDVIFTEGLLSCFVDWSSLKQQVEDPSLRLRELFRMGDISTLPPPRSLKSTYILGARRDLVAPQYSVKKLRQAWAGAHVRWLPGTQLTSLALHSGAFRRLIADSFKRL